MNIYNRLPLTRGLQEGIKDVLVLCLSCLKLLDPCCSSMQSVPVNPKSLKLFKASEIRPLRPYLRPPFKAAAALFKAVGPYLRLLGPYLRLLGPYLRLLGPYLRLLVIWG